MMPTLNEIFFFFIFIFSSTAHLQEVTASPVYTSYEVCIKERERIYFTKPISDLHRVVTPCQKIMLTAIPRCQ